MKKLLILVPMLVLGGCVTPVDQMLNNKFSDVVPTKPQVTGIWTTSVGPSLSTIKLNDDGNGLLCEDTSGNVTLNKVKYSDGKLFAQNGMILKVLKLSEDVLEAKTTVTAFNITMAYKKDSDLKAASAKCAKEL
ncbi:J517_1871 family lipoprotein [Acinetobacter nosocomialis]|uniref:J517_1871 family lipoprotein n=1 Tax=Acinetobacter nosocomialis TaxID=106654 RepID=UPI000E6ACF65|nr:J517_1871 family lipoprotein [Acinetobacter nosocomialis]